MFLAVLLCSYQAAYIKRTRRKPSTIIIEIDSSYISLRCSYSPRRSTLAWYYSRVACFVFCFHQVSTCLERLSKKYWLSKKNWKQVARSILRVHEKAHIQQMMKHRNEKFSTRVKRMNEVNVVNSSVVVWVTCRKCRKLCLCLLLM